MKNLKVNHPVKLIFVGGFLGSGKTTALAALAKRLIALGNRVGIITNDQSGNLVDTHIVRQMLSELGVPVEEVVKGCFCCKFDELIDHMEKILDHDPDVLMGEPVGSCTDFVAAVANPIKIHYKEAFRFAPFSTMVDPDRVQEFLLEETASGFPEEVSYLFQKQLEEADLIVLNKVDLIGESEKKRLVDELKSRFRDKEFLTVSAKTGDGLDQWLKILVSGRPGANTVLRQIDYDRYAKAEAVLGWLNGVAILTSESGFDAGQFLEKLAQSLQSAFKKTDSEVGHLKFVLTSGGKSMWANLTHLNSKPDISSASLGMLKRGSIIINARVVLEPKRLEAVVREILDDVSSEMGVVIRMDELQCFSPAYPDPPHLIRKRVE